MKFTTSTVIAAAAGFASIASAAPTKRDLTPIFLVVESADSRITGQCVSAYHTGAGLADATIAQCGPAPPKDFTFGDNRISFQPQGAQFPSQFNANNGGLSSYDNWAAVTVNAGTNGSDFTYTNELGFVQLTAGGEQGLGFIACQWAHFGQWQLFALSEADPVILPNCAKVTVKQGCYNTDAGCVNNVIA